MQSSETSLLIECYLSGQISERQWQQHLADTPGLIAPPEPPEDDDEDYDDPDYDPDDYDDMEDET